MHDLTTEIAAAAARAVVEDGLEYGSAKHHALKQLGLPPRTALPSNEVLEAAVLEHIAIFCADTQPAELLALRQMALLWMERLTEFRPHLSGAVWRGTATRLSDIYIQLYCDDSKSAEIMLINQGIRYEPGTLRGFAGLEVGVLSLQVPCKALQARVGIHLLNYDLDDLRQAPRNDAGGQSLRGSLTALKALLATSAL